MIKKGYFKFSVLNSYTIVDKLSWPRDMHRFTKIVQREGMYNNRSNRLSAIANHQTILTTCDTYRACVLRTGLHTLLAKQNGGKSQ